MHYEILDKSRTALLPKLAAFKKDFYLAGGTALTLQIGHRTSVDFDFFTDQPFDTETLFNIVQTLLPDATRIQEAEQTLGIVTGDGIRVSFYRYRYPLLNPCVETEHLRIASVLDIGCMKLSAIVSRAELKDYVDLYFILNEMSLPELLTASAKKMPQLDQNLILKSLVSFDDVIQEPITFQTGHQVSFDEIRNVLTKNVKDLQVIK